MRLGHDDKGREAMTCATCGGFVRLLTRTGDTPPAFDPTDAEPGNVLPGSWFLGFALTAAGYLPIALAEKLSDAWDAALHSNITGPLYFLATDPPRRVEYQKVIVETAP